MGPACASRIFVALLPIGASFASLVRICSGSSGPRLGTGFASREALALEATMTTRKLETSEWQRYFDEVAKHLPAMRVGISIMGESIGVQPESEDSALIGISYDSNDQVFEVDASNISHRVPNPKEIYVREEAGRLSSIEVITEDDMKQIIELRPLPSLPAS